MCLVLDSSVEAGWGLLGCVVGSGYLSGQGWLAGGVWVEEKSRSSDTTLFVQGRKNRWFKWATAAGNAGGQ